MRKHDWADTLARQIGADFGARSVSAMRFDLVAIRLRIVRQEGIGEGLDQARDAVAKKGEPDV